MNIVIYKQLHRKTNKPVIKAIAYCCRPISCIMESDAEVVLAIDKGKQGKSSELGKYRIESILKRESNSAGMLHSWKYCPSCGIKIEITEWNEDEEKV